MTTIILFALSGGLWRRALGGWLGFRRSLIVAAGTLLSAPLWLALPWWGALPATGLLTLYWVMGHDWTSLRALLLRYGPIGLWWWGVQRWWPDRWRAGGFVDGPIAVAEIGAGATVYGLLAALV